ncbi:MAG TPA: LTA synthase family protein [Chryseolinea sp.]
MKWLRRVSASEAERFTLDEAIPLLVQNFYRIVQLFRIMSFNLKSEMRQRTGIWILLCSVLIAVSTLTRISLLIKSSAEIDFSLVNVAGIFLWGMFYDLINAIYFGIPLLLYLWLVPERLYRKKGHRLALFVLFFALSFIIIFNAVAEWLFWDEFNVRFNFIAVDYLVYTTEVIGNIHQSYPLEWIIGAVVFLSTLIVWFLRPFMMNATLVYMPFKRRSALVGGYVILLVVVYFSVSNKYHRFSKNAHVNELGANGMYELFAAYRNNELDYEQFYEGIDDDKAFDLIRAQLKTTEATYTGHDHHSIERTIVNSGNEERLNVVLISVESFSADFMKLFGNTQAITPFLDSLSTKSLVFTNLYATGTRTVRGLEALSLCIPPTPGQSIVRRPDNENLFSLGKLFNEKGYRSEYIYGGYSYFDNMGYFFGHNGYQVVDRSELSNAEIAYENIWGVADENLFELSLRELDAHTPEKPVFAHIMTTSNHRPFTYPDGRIDIPSHTNREGAVKYTDYAIGRFIKQASKKAWFKNTIFIIVADHCASSAGKTEMPVSKYHIPMLIYSPDHVQPAVMSRLMSQIDIAPTLLGMLNFSYTSKFYGYDMFKLESGRERAFISTYQNLGYLKDHKLVILSPQLKVESFTLSDSNEPIGKGTDPAMVNEAIAWYQSASYSFKHKLMQ